MRRLAALAALVLLAGCAAPAPPPPPADEGPPGPGAPLAPGWLDANLPGEPRPFEDVLALAEDLRASPRAALLDEGRSVQGRALVGVRLALGDPAGKPTVFLTGSQHGDEPAGADAALLLATYYAWGGSDAERVLGALNLFVLLCANPDGRIAAERGNADGEDVNRDHMDLGTPEALAIHRAVHREDPVAVVDLHQFGPGLDQVPEPVGPAVVFEAASVQNPLAHPAVVQGSHRLETEVVRAVQEAFGPAAASSYPPTPSSQDSSIHRNHYGMHNHLSLLFEALRGLPRYEDEVRLHVVGAQAVLESLAADATWALAAKGEAEGEAARAPPAVRAYLAPPQQGLEGLAGLLAAHGLAANLSEAPAQATAVHYAAGLPRSDFPAGTLVVPLDQPDWRSAAEMFESSAAKDPNYERGPRDAGLDAWRALRAP